jgi:hypothetical protein
MSYREMNIQELFNNNKYIYLPDFLDKQNCYELVSEFKKLIEKGEAIKDDQCPLSFSVGHTKLFDSLLEQLTPSIESATGKKLHPTYSYARWYAPGDELKIHKDRPACEISATITLGFEGNPWPIFMGYDLNKINKSEIKMNIGDAVVYKGQEVFHWREKYTEGQWQAQVFIHYVDANGPNAEWKYDKRNTLAHHDNFDGDYVLIKNAFSKEGCQKIISQFEKDLNNLQPALVSGDVLNKNLRNSEKILMPNYKGLGATLTGIGFQANGKMWKFKVTHSNQSEFLRYNKNGHFVEHVDSFLDKVDNLETRKITTVLFLNDDYEGGRFFIKTGTEKTYPPIESGDVICFPSFILHGVEPITNGIRRSVVNWLVGPYFK